MNSAASLAKEKLPRGPKTRGTEWWDAPFDMPLNAGIPYVVQIVDDGLSLPQSRVLAVMTDTRDGAKRQSGEGNSERGYICDPGGHSRIARKTGLCRKTIYNAIKALIAKGIIRVFEVRWKGLQRVKTLYFARHYGDILPAWRSDKRWFHTARKCIVVRRRSKKFMTVEEAAGEWRMNPDRAPARGCGRGLTDIAIEIREAEQQRPEIPVVPAAPAINDEDLAAVHMELLRHTASCLQDAIDLIAKARIEADRMGYQSMGYGGPFPALTVAELIQRIAGQYRPNGRFPQPTPAWFLSKIGAHVSYWLKHDFEQMQSSVS